jgi:triacylglycerol lipase
MGNTVVSHSSIRTQNPIVLVHGIGVRPTYGPVKYFFKFSELLERERIPFLEVKLSPWRSFPERAKQLRDQILARFPHSKVNLIAHSMGGLDSRYLISQLSFGEHVSSLTTIGTPHGGTPIASLALKPYPSPERGILRLLFRKLGFPHEALEKLTPEFARDELPRLCPDDPSVRYYSTTSSIPRRKLHSRSLPLFWPTQPLIQKTEGENDGMISVESSQHGESLAVFSGDHYAQIGQFLGHSRGLDYPALYQMILRKLRKDGH